ncbi:alpha/beta fold hydrolase [Streptomyces griseoflavus]|uniref:alpha/beta fold hydrolase n=1 Tax=Streptomyces griseoflavus TaxID=35619 RepID=UPI00167CE0ED|nr:alpha/beta hydrolase [Streptomyces griseoflavus]GGV44926.1 alpha/beta hydrolase [Streptomyces griseoflavus]
MNTVQSADGTAIAYDRSGEGEPLVLVGGSFSERAHPTMTQLADELAPHFTVYNYDRRGRGDSADAPEYAVEREIEDLAAVIAEAGGSAKVFGLSAGGVLALKAAAAGVDITRVAVYDPPFAVDGTGPKPPAGFTEKLTELAASDRRGEAVEFFMTKGMGAPAEAVAGMRFAPFWAGLEALAHTLPYDTTITGDDFALPTEELSAVKVPVLVAHGGDADPWLHAGARATADAVPDARHRTLEGQGIAVEPSVLAPVLKEFFEG